MQKYRNAFSQDNSNVIRYTHSKFDICLYFQSNHKISVDSGIYEYVITICRKEWIIGSRTDILSFTALIFYKFRHLVSRENSKVEQ